MKLQNFEISSLIELQSAGLSWDLHNVGHFRGLELIAAENAAVMRWTARKGPNPWGGPENKFVGMALHFTGLHSLRVSPRDPDLPLSEDTCVSDILKVDPRIEHTDLYMRAVYEITARFSLAIRFQSRRLIEIESDNVQLIPICADAVPEQGVS